MSLEKRHPAPNLQLFPLGSHTGHLVVREIFSQISLTFPRGPKGKIEINGLGSHLPMTINTFDFVAFGAKLAGRHTGDMSQGLQFIAVGFVKVIVGAIVPK